MVTQALIAAGGYGTRMSADLNPMRSKSHMVFRGQTMLGYLLDSLKLAGIERFVIRANGHNYETTCLIVDQKRLNAVVKVVPSEGGFRNCPYYLRDLLDDQFLYICGHQPLPYLMLQQMITQAKRNACIMAAYDSKVYPIPIDRALFQYDSLHHLTGLKLDPKVRHHTYYLSNPYVLTQEVMRSFRKTGFKVTLSDYLCSRLLLHDSIGAVLSTAPPDFDTDQEFALTKRYLDRVFRDARKPVLAVGS